MNFRRIYSVTIVLIPLVAVYFYIRPSRPPIQPNVISNTIRISTTPLESDKAHSKEAIPQNCPPLLDYRLSLDKRVTSDLYNTVPILQSEAEIKLAISLVHDRAENDAVRHEVIELLRRSGYEGIFKELEKIIMDTRESSRFRAFAIQHLGELLNNRNIISDSHVSLMRTLIKQRDTPVSIRREAFWVLFRLKQDLSSEILGHLSVESPLTDLSIHCAYELDMKDTISVIRQCLKSENEPTKIAAIVVLGQWQDKDSKVEIEKALVAPSLRLQRTAKTALQKFSSD